METTKLTRRAALIGAAASTVAIAVPTVATLAAVGGLERTDRPPAFDLQTWLDAAEVDDIVQYHALQLAVALCKKRPGAWRFNTAMIESVGTVLYSRADHETFCGVQQDFTDYARRA